MVKYIVAIGIALVLVLLTYSIYKTKRYLSPKHLTLAFIGVILIAYLLYTCKSDD